MVGRTKVWGPVLLTVMAIAMIFAFASSAFAAERNPECLGCHQAVDTDWSFADVDRGTACVKCHTAGLTGSHPRHYPGSYCGSICHQPNGWGSSDLYAIPTVGTPSGAFASTMSVNASASVLHIIHSQTTWMSSVDVSDEKCSSCHAPASCTACHDSMAVSTYHRNHSSTGDASWTAQSPWSGTVGAGVIGGDLTMSTAFADENMCATSGCHDIAGMASGAPLQRETHTHAANAESPVADDVSFSPAPWGSKKLTVYSLDLAMYTNRAGYSLSSTFPAEVIELVGDTDPYGGISQVWIDGVLKATIDTYSPATKYQQILFRSQKLGAGDHNIKLVVTGTKQAASRGAWLVADGFRVYTSVNDFAAPKCLSCHPGQDSSHGFTYSHVITSTAYTAATYRGYACSSCHKSLMTDEHRRTSSKAASANCAACHTTYAPKVSPSTVISCTQTGLTAPGCHQSAQTPHNGVDTTHTPDATIASEAKCRSCHSGNLDIIHNNSVTTNAVVTDCLDCHGPNTAPEKACTGGCHVATGVNAMEDHPYPYLPHQGAGTDTTVSAATTGGFACTTCHDADMELGPEHARTTSQQTSSDPVICSTCHDLSYLPRAWDGRCGACHAGGAKAPVAHGAYTTKHNFAVYSATNETSCGKSNGTVCHDVTTADLVHNAALPGAGNCTSCHTAAGVPTKTLCTDCHTSHNIAGAHMAGAYPASTECLRCHDGFSNINTAHPSCATCHTNGTLVDYLQTNYTPACTQCHASGAGKLGTVYTPADPQHYVGTESTHTANAAQASSTFDYDGAASVYAAVRCDACHNMELKPEHITKSYTDFAGVPATYPDKCVACHEQRVDAITGVPKTASWNKTCTVCHATKHTGVATTHNGSAVILASKAGSPTAGSACGSSGCHDVANIQAIHNNSVTSNATVTNCTNTCHSSATTRAKADCSAVGCHFGMADHNAAHDPAENDPCARCHESADAKTVHGGAAYCYVCHSNPKYPGLTTTNTTVCYDCHNAGEIYSKDTTPYVTAHYAGTETTHTSSGNGTYNGYQCSQCHKLELKPEHFKSSALSTRVPGTYADACVDCHETKVDNFTLAWDKKCASCHPTTHQDRTAKHNSGAPGAGCGPSKAGGCHDVNDVAAIHNNSIPTNAMVPTCLTCHSSNASVPTATDCNTAGCHLGMVHTHSLNLTGSNYNNTTVTGCTNSGIGCHGSQAASPTPDYAGRYHPDTGCTTGRCHRNASNTATNTTQQDAAFNNPNMCQNCHGGRSTAPLMYDGAPDVISLTTATPQGHYNEATHTIVSVVQTMSVGGASSTTCVTCHQHSNPTGIDGEWYQHQVLQSYGNTTCYDCHSFVTPGDVAGTSRVGSLIATSVANGVHLGCADCHNALVMGAPYAIHEMNSSPPATATVASTPAFNCADPDCHGNAALNGGNPLEIHFLHKGDGKIVPFQRWDGSQYTTYTASRCNTTCHNYTAPYTMSNLTTTTECERRAEPQCVDCHDPLLQGWKPTAKTCGANGSCHITSPHSQMGPAHSVTALSAACIECHETTDLRSNHGYTSDDTCGSTGSNNVCHNLEGTVYTYNSVQYTFTLKGKKECKDCHALGKMPGVNRDHAPHDPNHYVGSETTHTAINQTGTFGAIYSVVATEGFDAATFPAAWTVSSGTLVATKNTAPTPYAGTYYAQIYSTTTSRTAHYFQRTFDTGAVSSPTVSFMYQTPNMSTSDYARLEYSTDGVSFTQLWNLSATAQSTWTTVGPIAVPRSTSLTLRFSASTNANNSDKFCVDSFVLKPGDAQGASCFLTCHYSEMKPEHFKPSAEATRVPGIYSDKCIDCHENRVDAFDVTKKFNDWNRTCVQCHGDEKHYGQTAKHDASAVAGASTCGGSGCHYIKDVAVIHNNSALGNSWPTNPAQSCTVCHSSKDNAPAPPTGYESYSALDCGLPGCHQGTTAHAHELDRDGSVFNPATVTGCVDSGAGCHGNLASTNYATGYHASVGCLSGNCHNAGATNHNDPQFNDPNTCMNCHGGGTLLYAGATDRIPVTGASPNGHYPETTHTATASSRTASLTAGGTISARCNQCHNEVNATGVDGLYNQHQGVGGTITNVNCVDCHNYNVGVSAVITGNWTTDTCADCHNASLMAANVAHSASIAPTVTATEYNAGVATPGTCVTTGCHTTTNLHALHKGTASTSSTRTALGCAFAGCHDYTKQGKKPTLKSCGVGGACHTSDAHNPLAHNVVDSANCTRCHEGAAGAAATDIRTVYKTTGYGNVVAHDACSSCHNGSLVLPAGTDCIGCHNGTKVGTHLYTPYTSTSTAGSAGHYYTASHDASLVTGATYGTSGYGDTLSDFHGTTVNYERQCTSCHTIYLREEHDKNTVAFNLGGKADKCAACHENKVDNWSARWTGSCAGEADSCHASTSALHSDRDTKHDASTQVMSAPGSAMGPSVITSTQEFTGATLPDSWTTTAAATVKITTTDTAGTGNSVLWAMNGTTAGYNIVKTYSTAGYASANVTFKYKRNGSTTTDYIACQYSTNGTAWTELVRYTTNATTWTQSGTYTLPAGAATVYLRFIGYCNATTEYNKIDDIKVTLATAAGPGSALPANSTAAVSCQNNPNGTECHNVADVANIHSRTPNSGCPICHTSTTSHPTNLNCQATGCHVGVNADNHNTAWHESTIGSNTVGVFSGQTFAVNWCRGCHDDSIDNEHFALTAYAATPCSLCHKKSANSGAPTNVTAVNASSTIHADTTSGNELCEDCHKTVVTSTTTSGTAFAIHAQRSGLATPGASAVTTGGLQFSPTWSGHRLFSNMWGSKTTFTTAVDRVAANRTWTTPTVTSWLVSGWQDSRKMVTCSDCHGDVSGATGPHGGSVTVHYAIRTGTTEYDNSYTSGTLYLGSSASMSNTTNLCAKCHTTTSMGYNTAHATSDHYSSTMGQCVDCHIRIPHAWKRPRLIGYYTDPAPYNTIQSTSLNGITDKAYTPTGWSKSNCYASCSSDHSTVPSPKWP